MTKKTHPSNDVQKTQSSKTTTTTESNNDLTGFGSKKSYPKPPGSGSEEARLTRRACTSSSQEDGTTTTTTTTSISGDNIHVMSGRERLKRHRIEVAGRVWVPDMWGQEGLLKDWIDCTAFDATLVRSNIMSARAALVQVGRIKASSSGLTGVK